MMPLKSGAPASRRHLLWNSAGRTPNGTRAVTFRILITPTSFSMSSSDWRTAFRPGYERNWPKRRAATASLPSMPLSIRGMAGTILRFRLLPNWYRPRF